MIEKITQELADLAINDILYNKRYARIDITRLKKGIKNNHTNIDGNLRNNSKDSLMPFIKFFRDKINYDDIILDNIDKINSRITSHWDSTDIDYNTNSIDTKNKTKFTLLELCFIATIDYSVTYKIKTKFLKGEISKRNLLIIRDKIEEFISKGDTDEIKALKEQYGRELELDEDFSEDKYLATFIKMRSLDVITEYFQLNNAYYAYYIKSYLELCTTKSFNDKKLMVINNIREVLKDLLEQIFDRDYIDLIEKNIHEIKNNKSITLIDNKNYRDILQDKIKDIKNFLTEGNVYWIESCLNRSNIKKDYQKEMLILLHEKLSNEKLQASLFNSLDKKNKIISVKYMEDEDKIISTIINECLESNDFINKINQLIVTKECYQKGLIDKVEKTIFEMKCKETKKTKDKTRLSKEDIQTIDKLISDDKYKFELHKENLFNDIAKVEDLLNQMSSYMTECIPDVLNSIIQIKMNHADIDIKNIYKEFNKIDNKIISYIANEEMTGIMMSDNELVVNLLAFALLDFDAALKDILHILDKKSNDSYKKYIQLEEKYYVTGKEEINKQSIAKMKRTLQKRYKESQEYINNISDKTDNILINLNKEEEAES